jgi:hypothetical protein
MSQIQLNFDFNVLESFRISWELDRELLFALG